MSEKWTAEITVEFVPLPPEKEEAYWAALRYFAGLMQKYMLEENAQKEKENETQVTNK